MKCGPEPLNRSPHRQLSASRPALPRRPETKSHCMSGKGSMDGANRPGPTRPQTAQHRPPSRQQKRHRARPRIEEPDGIPQSSRSDAENSRRSSEGKSGRQALAQNEELSLPSRCPFPQRAQSRRFSRREQYRLFEHRRRQSRPEFSQWSRLSASAIGQLTLTGLLHPLAPGTGSFLRIRALNPNRQ